jgi:hypothetical protein
LVVCGMGLLAFWIRLRIFVRQPRATVVLMFAAEVRGVPDVALGKLDAQLLSRSIGTLAAGCQRSGGIRQAGGVGRT